MKSLYSLILIASLVVLQRVGVVAIDSATDVPREGVRSAGNLKLTKNLSVHRLTDHAAGAALATGVSEKIYGLHYNSVKNTWTLYASVIQLKTTSIYGRPGEIAQIEYSLDGVSPRYAWSVVKMDNYSFSGNPNRMVAKGQNIQLYVSGVYVSPRGVDWEKCPKEDVYCMNASFIEGGFPPSLDYDRLTLCPSNTIIRSGYGPDDWINGMLAWKIRI